MADLGRSEALAPALQSLYRPVGHPSLAPGQAARLVPGQPLALHYPLAVAADEIDPYGWRYSQPRNGWRMHAGVDLVVVEGTPVLAAQAGEVALVSWVEGYGLTVVLDHGRGWQTLYAHLAEVAVRPGERLAVGSALGRVGRSGQASTPHLHFELRRRQGESVVALDPVPVLPAPHRTGATLASE